MVLTGVLDTKDTKDDLPYFWAVIKEAPCMPPLHCHIMLKLHLGWLMCMACVTITEAIVTITEAIVTLTEAIVTLTEAIVTLTEAIVTLTEEV